MGTTTATQLGEHATGDRSPEPDELSEKLRAQLERDLRRAIAMGLTLDSLFDMIFDPKPHNVSKSQRAA